MVSTELIYLAVSAIAATLLLGVVARVLKFAVRVILLLLLTTSVYFLLSNQNIRSRVERTFDAAKKTVRPVHLKDQWKGQLKDQLAPFKSAE